MAEGGDSGARIAGSSAAVMEDQAISAPTLIEKLCCPQPVAIVRKRTVTINPPPHGKRRSEGRGNFNPMISVYHLISKNNFEKFQTDFRLLYIHTYGQTLLEIAGMKAGDGEVTGNSLVELPAFYKCDVQLKEHYY